MATVYDFLNADSSEVEEQRVIRVAGTTGDVLTLQANGTVSPAPGGGSQTLTASIPISAAEILTFGAAVPRKVLVAAPGSERMLLPSALVVNFVPGLTPYTLGGGTFGFGWGDAGTGNAKVWGNTAEFDADSILGSVAPVTKLAVSATFDTDVNGSPPGRLSATTDVDNAALTFGLAPASTGGVPPEDGNGTLLVTFTYSIIDLP